MTLPELIGCMDAIGVRLDLRLVVDAPAGTLTPEHRDVIRSHRGALLVHLAREAQWETLQPQRWGSPENYDLPNLVVDRPSPGRTPAPAPAIDDALAARVARAGALLPVPIDEFIGFLADQGLDESGIYDAVMFHAPAIWRLTSEQAERFRAFAEQAISEALPAELGEETSPSNFEPPR